MSEQAVPRRLLIKAGAALWLVALLVVLDGRGTLTTYAAVSPAATVIFLAAGLSLIAAGRLAATDRSTGSLWVLCALAGIAWLCPALVGWSAGPGFGRGVGMVLAPFLMPILVHLLLASPGRGLHRPVQRIMVVAAYSLTTVTTVVSALTWDPFFDAHCWNNCADNIFLLVNDPSIAGSSQTIQRRSVIVFGVIAVLSVKWKVLVGNRIARLVGWTTKVPAALAVGAQVTCAAALLADPAENPERSPFIGIFFLRAAALITLSVGIGWLVLHGRRRRAAVVELITDLEATSGMGSLQSLLSESFGDSSLTVAYWLPHFLRFVDSSGRPVQSDPDQERVEISVVRGDEMIAVISQDPTGVDDQALLNRIGAAALLALDNERLKVELLAYLDDVRASRLRIVTAADQARRQIERDLHDGAQQRLLAVLYELRMAHTSAVQNGQRSAGLEALITGVQAALVELRELAHGIFPSVLDESGLEAALWTLTDQTPRPVRIGPISSERLPPAVERAAYLVVAETLAGLGSGEGLLSVSIQRRTDTAREKETARHDTLLVEIKADDLRLAHVVVDRIGAAGGVVTADVGLIRAEIPCG